MTPPSGVASYKGKHVIFRIQLLYNRIALNAWILLFAVLPINTANQVAIFGGKQCLKSNTLITYYDVNLIVIQRFIFTAAIDFRSKYLLNCDSHTLESTSRILAI